jgi:6-phosphofructokinase 1
LAKVKRIGVLTGGGDCPGLNAVLRAVVKTAENDYNVSVVGFLDGYEGMVENRYRELTPKDVSGILTRGGTILGTSNRADPFHYPVLEGENDEYIYLDRSSQAVRNFESLGLDALIAIGGDGTMAASAGMLKKGMPVVGVPKTIDNDLAGTDVTFGFDSACTAATDAVDRLHTTAQAHHRVMFVEVMGRYAGWLALHAGIAGGGDIILIPEIPYDIEAICDAVKERNARGKNFSIVVVGEGSRSIDGEMVVKRTIKNSPDMVRLGGVSYQVAAQVEGLTNIECRVTILGHLLRGGSPTPFDRILATQFGTEAVHVVMRREFGRMVGLHGTTIGTTSIADVAGKLRTVTPDHPLIKVAQSLGICIGVAPGVEIESAISHPAVSH